MNTPKMVLTRAYYDSELLETVLKRECGRGVFIDSTAEKDMAKVRARAEITTPHERKRSKVRPLSSPMRI